MAAIADMVAAALLHRAAAGLADSSVRARSMALAYACCAAAGLLAGGGSPVASLQGALLLAAAAAALAPGCALLAALLVAAGSADWPPGAVLLSVPLALLAVQAAAPIGSSPPPAATLKRVGAFCALVAASVAALLQLRDLLPHQQAGMLSSWLGLGGSWAPAVPAPPPSSPGSVDWVGSRTAQQSPFEPPAPLLRAAALQPGLGLQWYLLAQAFPKFRTFFLYALTALPAATMLPLALRFPGRPQMLLVAGALLRSLLHPAPRPVMVALWVGLLPLARGPLEGVAVGLPWVGLGLGAALLLSNAAMQLWLVSGGGNANFLYGMNLLWGGLQAMLLLQLLRSAARQEARAPAADGRDGTAAAGASGSSKQD